MTLYYLLIAATLVGLYRIFEKAGRQGWEAIVPIYNIYVLSQLIGRQQWWVVLYIIPFVNVVVWILDSIEVAKRFGKDAIWGVGFALLTFVFAPLFGFSEEYRWRSA